MRTIFERLALFSIVACLVLCSCQSTYEKLSDSEKLTDQEKQRLIDLGRAFILRTKNIATTEEKAMIRSQAPTDIKIRYTAPKTGNVQIIWELKKKAITARVRGVLVGENHSWSLSVRHYGEIIYTPQAKLKMKPRHEASPKDFIDILQKNQELTKETK